MYVSFCSSDPVDNKKVEVLLYVCVLWKKKKHWQLFFMLLHQLSAFGRLLCKTFLHLSVAHVDNLHLILFFKNDWIELIANEMNTTSNTCTEFADKSQIKHPPNMRNFALFSFSFFTFIHIVLRNSGEQQMFFYQCDIFRLHWYL